MKPVLTFEKYQEGLAANKLLGLFCQNCKAYTIPPQAACRECGNVNLTIEELEKNGIIKTFTVIRTAADGFTPPFVVAMVQTASGAYLMGNLINFDPEKADMQLIGKKAEIQAALCPTIDIYSPIFII